MSEAPALVISPDEPRGDVQRHLARVLEAAGSSSAMTDARLILCAALGVDHAALLRDQDKPIGVEAAGRVKDMAARRLRHEPVSRILGHREFFGLDFAVDPSVLDPRPDTETLVEAAIDAFAGRWQAPLKMLDLGVGSGAILGALLVHFPNAVGVGVDLSELACRTAKRNLETLGFRARSAIVRGYWANALAGQFDIVVSNPPYIAGDAIASLDPDVCDYDPHMALDGGADGYDAYRAIARELPTLLTRDGVAVLELGQGQGNIVRDLLQSAGLCVTGTRRDLAGIERAIVARRHPD
ncbi:MAG TPA: peptide chain release factor N(5)-glutamine methyltransferase [Methylovirgula sp.]|jgi:release factor glutamine methyltransferase